MLKIICRQVDRKREVPLYLQGVLALVLDGALLVRCAAWLRMTLRLPLPDATSLTARRCVSHCMTWRLAQHVALY